MNRVKVGSLGLFSLDLAGILSGPVADCKVSAADKGLAGPVLVQLVSVRILNHAAVHNQDAKVVVSTYVVEYFWRPVALL